MIFRREVNQEDMRRFYPSIYAESEKETLSDKYLYIPTYKLINSLERNGFKVVGAKQQGSRTNSREFAKHVVYMQPITNELALKNVGDEIPLLALTNSHNGLSSFAIDTAFHRLVCSNGLLMPSQSFNSAKIVHKKGMENDVIEASFRVMKSFPKQIELIEAMKTTQLESGEKLLLAQSASNIAFDEKEIEINREIGNAIESKLLRARRMADQKNDLWTTFNVIQENIIKGGFRIVRENEEGRRSLAKTRAVKAIDRDAKLNKELMTLAQKMLEIKTGQTLAI